MTIFYTSDTHFGHDNIITFAERPFKDVQEMNEILIQRWNEVVQPSDHIWHLGDLTMHRQLDGRILSRLNGHKRLIMGNHDVAPIRDYVKWFEKVKASHVHDHILFTHIPIHPESMGRFSANVHGHIHDRDPFKPVKRQPYDKVWPGKVQTESGVSPYINICVERTHYRPISLEEVKDLIRKAS